MSIKKNDPDKHLRQIHHLASRLPWIVVIVISIVVILTIFQVYFFGR
jgi:uncharacterized Rmd1/YagE family protein